MTIIALAHQIQVKAEAVHMRFLRLGKRQPAVGGVGGVVDVGRLAAPVARGDTFDLECQDIGDRS
jgi:hypothetical protein